MGHLNSMNIFLRQEIDRMQKVITIVRNSLNDLKLAIEGTIVMSENLRDALDNMYDARIPQVWKRVSWESSTLGFWFTELLDRNAQLSTWIFKGRPNVFWITGFFNPQGFLTAMKQEATRAHKDWALDKVAVHNEVLKQTREEITAPPPDVLETPVTSDRFVDDTKLGGAAESLEGREGLQRDLDKSEGWAITNHVKFNKRKCWIVHLGWGNPGCTGRLGNERLESSARKGLGVLVNGKLNMSQQCPGSQEGNHVLRVIRQSITSWLREGIVLLCSALRQPHPEYCVGTII
ncbi:hypothetical protein BTVI_25205 [Pitangus sulphuratus]|nr:hypothetical protein BTVI_25205 [Pitangus sulphuratus]